MPSCHPELHILTMAYVLKKNIVLSFLISVISFHACDIILIDAFWKLRPLPHLKNPPGLVLLKRSTDGFKWSEQWLNSVCLLKSDVRRGTDLLPLT